MGCELPQDCSSAQRVSQERNNMCGLLRCVLVHILSVQWFPLQVINATEVNEYYFIKILYMCCTYTRYVLHSAVPYILHYFLEKKRIYFIVLHASWTFQWEMLTLDLEMNKCWNLHRCLISFLLMLLPFSRLGPYLLKLLLKHLPAVSVEFPL